MGLSIYTYVDCHAIDDERWEAVYLTSLQRLLESPDLWPLLTGRTP